MDVENANCKLHISKCEDMEVLPIPKPLKIDQEVVGLDMLLQELHKVFSNDYVNVNDVQRLMAGYTSDPKDWKKYAKFDRFRYTRNLVDAGNGAFNVMILCWGPGNSSAIHDHADSHCFMKLLSGSLEEVRYKWPENCEPEVLKKYKNKSRSRCCSTNEKKDLEEDMSKLEVSCDKQEKCKGGNECEEEVEYELQDMEEIGRTKLEINDVCYINDALGLHRMENPSHVDGAVSLHLYCPPFDSCRVFDPRTGRPTTVQVTFWSMYGKKVKRVIEANSLADSQQ